MAWGITKIPIDKRKLTWEGIALKADAAASRRDSVGLFILDFAQTLMSLERPSLPLDEGIGVIRALPLVPDLLRHASHP